MYRNNLLNIIDLMIKTKFLLLSLILFASSSICFAQEIEGQDAQQNLNKIGGISTDNIIVRKFDNRYEGIVGSPYYAAEWLEGDIVMENNRSIEKAKLKYNMYEDELILLQPKAGSLYVDKENVRSFTLIHPNGKKDLFTKYRHPENPEHNQYFRAVCLGKMNLWEHTKVIFEKANFEGGYSIDKKYDEFKQYTEYFYTYGDMPFPAKLKTSANAVIKVFPDHQDQIRQFIKSNLLDLRIAENMVRVFDFYGQIKD